MTSPQPIWNLCVSVDRVRGLSLPSPASLTSTLTPMRITIARYKRWLWAPLQEPGSPRER